MNSTNNVGSAVPSVGGAQSGGNFTIKMNAGLAFARCMRSNGVPNFPDPSSGGGVTITSGNGIDPGSPQFQSAQRACQKYLPAEKAPSPAQVAKMQANLLKFSACMRSHGVP